MLVTAAKALLALAPCVTQQIIGLFNFCCSAQGAKASIPMTVIYCLEKDRLAPQC
jgi:hypothetical protein